MNLKLNALMGLSDKTEISFPVYLQVHIGEVGIQLKIVIAHHPNLL